MIGAIFGDILASNYKNGTPTYTDNSVMTIAVCYCLLKKFFENENLLEEDRKLVESMKNVCCKYHDCGYDAEFKKWLYSSRLEAYDEDGYEAATRISGVPYASSTRIEMKYLSRRLTQISHNNKEALKGAETVCNMIWEAKHGADKKNIGALIKSFYYSNLDHLSRDDELTDEDRRSCGKVVPYALKAFLDSDNFNDAMLKAAGIDHGNSAITSITGAISEAFYGVQEADREYVYKYLDDYLIKVLITFESIYENTKKN